MKRYLPLLLLFISTFNHADIDIIDDKIEQRRAGLDFNKVIFIDHDLNRVELRQHKDLINGTYQTTKQVIKVSLQKAGARRTATRSLEVYSVLKNHTDYDLQVEARTLFFDADQIPLNDQTAWKRVYLPINAFGTYKEFSVSPLASYFITEIREAR